jgi:hypothetical protein
MIIAFGQDEEGVVCQDDKILNVSLMIQNVLCMLAWHFNSYMLKTLFSIYCYSFQNGLLISKELCYYRYKTNDLRDLYTCMLHYSRLKHTLPFAFPC